MSPRSSVERPAEPPEALPITTVVADSVEALERLRPDWNRLRRGRSLVTPNADPDRYLATLRGLGGRARPYVAMLHEGAEPRALIIGREETRPGRIRLGYLQLPALSFRSLDIVYGGLITDDSQQAVRAVDDHLRHLIDTGRVEQIMINHLPRGDRIGAAISADRALARRSVADTPEPHWRFALVPGSYEQTIQCFSRKHRYNMRRADPLLVCVIRDLCESKIRWIDYGFGDSPYKRIHGTESWNESAVHLYARTVRASSTRVVHRLAGGLNRCVSDVAARCGVLTQAKKRWRGRLAGKRKSPTVDRGWK